MKERKYYNSFADFLHDDGEDEISLEIIIKEREYGKAKAIAEAIERTINNGHFKES